MTKHHLGYLCHATAYDLEIHLNVNCIYRKLEFENDNEELQLTYSENKLIAISYTLFSSFVENVSCEDVTSQTKSKRKLDICYE